MDNNKNALFLSSCAIVSRENTKKDGLGCLVAGLPHDRIRAAAGGIV